MGKRGPAGAPTALRLLRGDQDSRINHNEPVVREAIPEPPDTLTDAVREVWEYTLRELIYMKIAAAADRDALVCYCEAVVTHRRASAALANGDILTNGDRGGKIRHPALQIQRDAAQTIRGFAQEFGLTPSARAGIVMDGGKVASDVNPFAAAG